MKTARAVADEAEGVEVPAGAVAARRLPPLGMLPAWRALAAAALEPNPFFSPALAHAGLEHLAGDDVSLAAASDETGRLVALAPITPTRLGRLVPAVSVWTHVYGPLGTPLIDAARPDEAVARLVSILEGRRAGGAILVFPDLPLDGPVALALEAHAKAAGRPVQHLDVRSRAVLLRIEGEAEAIRDRLARKKRKEFGRQMRRLADLGTVTIARAGTKAELEAALDAFLELEAAGWKGRGGSALASRSGSLAFARSAMSNAADGEAAIDTISLDGRPVAMLAGFRSGSLALTWKIAHDEALGRFSPGVQIMLEGSDAWLRDPAVNRIDSLAASDHPMIDPLWPARMRVGTLAMGPAGGSALFRLAVLAARAEVRARRTLRGRLHRRAGSHPGKETPT